MGIKNFIIKRGKKAADSIAKLSSLSPEQLSIVEQTKEKLFIELADHDPLGASAEVYTDGLIASAGIEIFSAYLPQLSSIYAPVDSSSEYALPFSPDFNIRYFNITKWVFDDEEDCLEKLVNVYTVLSDASCNISLMFHRTKHKTDVYLALTNTENAENNREARSYIERIEGALKGNFPGAEWSDIKAGIPEFLQNSRMSVAVASNIPTEKSDKFKSQTIEKLLDGIVPENYEQEYVLILMATPIQDAEERKLRLSELYSGLAPYSEWQTNYTYTESGSTSSSATFGVNVGASAGVQNGTQQSVTNNTSNTTNQGTTDSTTDSTGTADTRQSSASDSVSQATAKTKGFSTANSSNRTTSNSTSHAFGTNNSHSVSESDNISAGVRAGISLGKANIGADVSKGHTNGVQDTLGNSITDTDSQSLAESIGKTFTESNSNTLTDTTAKAITEGAASTVSRTTAKALANTVGKAVTRGVATTAGRFASTNLGANFGVNFARASNVTATIGKNEGITQNFTNYTIKHALEKLQQQMKRYELSTALGMWDFAAYVLSEDHTTANNVAHTYIALTQGEESYMSSASVNLWRGDTSDNGQAEEICRYLRELRQPIFGLDISLLDEHPELYFYPTVVTAATSLSGKELAYSLNFPKRSVAGLPVIECVPFGRSITTYNTLDEKTDKIELGKIFHMHHEEKNPVELNMDSLASHTFITGSTGSGKSNTIYKILDEAIKNDVGFLVVEPAKGEYKHIFGNEKNVDVFGTNPKTMPLLRLDPFSFPSEIHVLEHIDRLVEIFCVCWPMYAAMPAVLKNAVELAYTDCGWNLTDSSNKYGDRLFPCFDDVAINVKSIIDSSEYDYENKGAYKGSLLTRLNSLTNGINGLIFSKNEISEQKLFDSCTIVDLSRVGSAETKSLIMGILVLKLQEHRMSGDNMNSRLRHITVLEEAHNILRKTTYSHSQESGDLIGKSVEMLANAIAEMRTYGEGFIIADQSPDLLDMSVIRNTNTKIILRLPDLTDRELVGKAANLSENQIMELAKLPCGVAAVYQNEWIEPVLCKVSHFDYTNHNYRYLLHEQESVSTENKRLELAELLLSDGSHDIGLSLKDLDYNHIGVELASSVKVKLLRYIGSARTEPKMTRVAPIINAMFPEISKAVSDAYHDSIKPADWTEAAVSRLEQFDFAISSQLRNRIIHSIVLYHTLLKDNRPDMLERWLNEGGIR